MSFFNKVGEKLEERLNNKVSHELQPMFTAKMVDMYGAAVTNVMLQLKEGNFVCSKPCRCGEKSKEHKFPEDCSELCPCMQALKEREKGKK